MRFDTKFNATNHRIDVEMHVGTGLRFETDFGVVHEVTLYKDADLYTGAYQVTPKTGAQVLPTAQKLMTGDMTVKAIPYYETSNLSDGETVYIGTEVEIYGD